MAKKPATPIEAVSEVRQQITETETRIEETRRAKTSLPDALANMQKNMDRVTEDAGRALQLHQFAQPGYVPTNSCGLDSLSAFTLAVLTNPKGVREYLEREIREYYLLDGPTVSEADRPALIAELEKQRWKLEVEEERLIEAAAADGIDIDRRGDVRPEIVLGLAKGEKPAWNFTSDRLDRITGSADAAKSLYDVRQDAWLEAREVLMREESRLASMERGNEPEPGIKYQRQTVEITRKTHDRAKALREEAHESLQAKLAVADNLRRWVEENKANRPTPYSGEDFQLHSQTQQNYVTTPGKQFAGGYEFGKNRTLG